MIGTTVLINLLTHIFFKKGLIHSLLRSRQGIYKSDVIMRYRKSNLEQKKKVSDMLSVLPKEMQAIRDCEAILMSEKEKQTNKKKEVVSENSNDGKASKP